MQYQDYDRTMKQITVLTLVLSLLSACTSRSTPIVAFANEGIDLDGIQWMEEAAIRDGIEFDPWGIYAVDEGLAFLFGGLSVSPGTIRSVVLRSDDGGEHWCEVMESQQGSDVTEMVFVEDGLGWALVVWTVEGPGPARLYHTTDYGRNWQELSSIPYPGGHSFTFDLQLFSNRQGQVRVNRFMEEVYCLFNTTDGGLTWNETGDCCDDDECDFERRSQDTALAQDGSRWQFEVDSSDVERDLREIAVSRQLSHEDTWTVVSRIPVHFEYAEGQPVISQQE